jgi:hypothetical protein
MNFPHGKPIAASTRPALELISLARLSPELARRNLRALLLANPNYFGNVTGSSFKAVLHIQEDTTYERLGCFGYSPELKQLRATITINQTEGYSGNIRANGSEEYVRFYLSSDDGKTWQDQGMTAVNVFDAPGPKPVEHTVALEIDPEEEFCIQNLPKVRAILSWNWAPPAGAPNWTPVWGNVLDAQIRIEDFEFVLLSSLLSETKVQVTKEIEQWADLLQPVQVGALHTGSVAAHSSSRSLGAWDRAHWNNGQASRYNRHSVGVCIGVGS